MTASPERRFAALSVADRDELAATAELVLAVAPSTTVVTGPRTATMLVELTESVQDQPFHVGEVVVSEAEVTVDGRAGHGLVLGHDVERALAAAVCDAAVEAGVLVSDVEALVTQTEERVRRAHAARARRVAGTRVTMDVVG